jgi:integrase
VASIRTRVRADGSTAYNVMYTLDGRQSSVTFDAEEPATKFKTLIDTVGARKAMDAWGISDTPKAPPSTVTVIQWLNAHIDQMTGVEQKTLDDYRRYTRQLEEFFGDLPLTALDRDDIARWVTHLEVTVGNSPKTIRNKHGFLSSALGAAVPKHIDSNPAAGRRLPKGDGDEDEMRMLTRGEFASLLEATTEFWRPLLEFLVASGARWGEVAALKPGDVDREGCTVKIRRAWKHSSAGYEIGPPKTKRSRRSIKVPARILEQLDYTNEWLFVNRDGGPVRYVGFRQRVWDKAVARAKLDPAPTPHDLRHTCASWMLSGGIPVTVVSRHLGHENISVTVDIYGDVDETAAQAAADFMDGALSGAAASPKQGPAGKRRRLKVVG